MKMLNLGLLLVLLAAVGANVAIDPDPAIPARDYLPEMAYSRAAESYAANASLPAGAALQAPPDDTIARDASLVRYEATPAGAVRAGVELTAPPASPQDVERGRAVFQTFCTPCHGAGGVGDGPVVTRGVPPPPSLLAQRAREMKDGQLFHVLTYGQQNMASYASQIDAPDRWRVVAYVRQLQGSSRP